MGVWPLHKVNPPQAPRSNYSQMWKILLEAWVQDVGRGIAGQSWAKPVVVLLGPELQGLFMKVGMMDKLLCSKGWRLE